MRLSLELTRSPRPPLPTSYAYVCFHARDAAYEQGNANYLPGEHTYRNSDIDTYLPAMEALTYRGYTTLRMGAKVERALTTRTPGIIDYATTERTDFLDVWLPARCAFYVGDADGLASLAMVFRRPVVFANYVPLEYVWSWGPQDLFIPKLLQWQATGQTLTFPELLTRGFGRFLRSSQYQTQGLTVINNTPTQIRDVVLEQESRLHGQWQTSAEDELLQQRFWSLLMDQPGAAELHGTIRSRMGAVFLRQHQQLLDVRRD